MEVFSIFCFPDLDKVTLALACMPVQLNLHQIGNNQEMVAFID